MREVAEFRQYATYCRSIAWVTSDADNKRRLLEMATVWLLLAHEREEKVRGQDFPRLNDQRNRHIR